MRAAIQMFLLAILLATGTFQWPTHIVIMHTNDLHGQALSRNGVGGMAEIGTVIRAARADLILDAGDIFTGSLVSDDFQALPMIQAMNVIGYSAGAVGNHEFDHGIEALRMRIRDAKFPMLTANLITGIPELRKHTILNAKGIRFGISGSRPAGCMRSRILRKCAVLKCATLSSRWRKFYPRCAASRTL